MAAAIATLPPVFAGPRSDRRRRLSGWLHSSFWLTPGFILMLSLALLFSQCVGLAHGIVHAGLPSAGGDTAFEAALFDYPDGAENSADDQPQSSGDVADGGKQGAQHSRHHHSCVEYDAAAGSAGVHINFFIPPLIPGGRVLALWQAFASWDAPFICHFSSRAPPR